MPPALKPAEFLIASLWSMPFLVIHGLGLTLALKRWKQHPRRSAFAAPAFGIFLFNILLSRFTFYWRWNQMEPQGFARAIRVISVANHASNLLSLVAWGLILLALFQKRDGAEA